MSNQRNSRGVEQPIALDGKFSNAHPTLGHCVELSGPQIVVCHFLYCVIAPLPPTPPIRVPGVKLGTLSKAVKVQLERLLPVVLTRDTTLKLAIGHSAYCTDVYPTDIVTLGKQGPL